ncbi:hypothetical protein HWV62_11942 [Athelia sp. TMB]|nr:hypothetical protein HWV62_11942 [Athelia sp. TMB]
MLERLWGRFYPNYPIPDELNEQIGDYFAGEGIFVNMEALITIETKKAESQLA